jgi:hypothetical protein
VKNLEVGQGSSLSRAPYLVAVSIETEQAEQLAEKSLFLSFRGALPAEESLFSCL